MIRELREEDCKDALLPLKEAEIYYFRGYLQEEKAKDYLNNLLHELPWQQDAIKIFGKTLLQPRLTALLAENEKSYTYSGITMQPSPFPPRLLDLKEKVEQKTGTTFTTCLANYYRDGSDSMGWHADDEKELGPNPSIASLSLGASRMFHLKHRKEKQLRYKIALQSGDLLLMKGVTQHFWLHSISKTAKPVGARINLTFRQI